MVTRGSAGIDAMTTGGRLKLLLPTALFFLLNFFLFGPASIYRGNASEFTVDFSVIAALYAVPFMVSLAVVLFVGIIPLKRYLRVYAMALFAIAVLMWFEGNVLLWNYGAFDGTRIPWNDYSRRGFLDLSIWVLVFLLAFNFRKSLFKAVSSASILFIALQLIALMAGVVSTPGAFSSDRPLAERPPESLFEYSKNFNIIHIITDHFQSDAFQHIIVEDKLFDDFEGFVFFRENMTVAAHTKYAVPAIFSGEMAPRGIDSDGMVNESIGKMGFQNILFENGFDVHLVPSGQFPAEKYTSYYRPSKPYGASSEKIAGVTAAFMMDLTLFRHLPHYIKKFIFNDRNWRVTPAVFNGDGGPKVGYYHHIEFFNDYIERVAPQKDKPAYHFVHLMPPHPPFMLSDDCSYSGGVKDVSVSQFMNESRCMVFLLNRYLKKLKAIGLYDSSLIIIQSDHGFGPKPEMLDDALPGVYLPIGRSLALLAVKRPHSRGPITATTAQSMVTDTGGTIIKEAGIKSDFPGISFFDIDPDAVRERWFNNQYKVEGSVYKHASWKKLKTLRHLVGLEDMPCRSNEPIHFGLLGNAQPCMRSGWWGPESGHSWTTGSGASLVISMSEPPPREVTLKMKFKSYIFKGKNDRQRLRILVNGNEAASWEITVPFPKRMERTVAIPGSFFTYPEPTEIRFLTPDSVSMKEMGIGAMTLKFGIALQRLELY